MNRKQKKAKRLKATQHTKSQARAYFTPHEAQSIQSWSEAQEQIDCEIGELFEPSKNTSKWCALIIAICMLITLWIYKVNT